MVPVFAVKKKADQDDHRNRRTPMQCVGIETENDEPDIGRDDRPAGAVACSALLSRREPEAVDKCPLNKGRYNLKQKKEHDHSKDGIEYAVEKIQSHPFEYSDADEGRQYSFSLNTVVSRFDHGMSYLSTRAIFLLYQFIKSDVSKLKQR